MSADSEFIVNQVDIFVEEIERNLILNPGMTLPNKFNEYLSDIRIYITLPEADKYIYYFRSFQGPLDMLQCVFQFV